MAEPARQLVGGDPGKKRAAAPKALTEPTFVNEAYGCDPPESLLIRGIKTNLTYQLP